MDSGRARLAGFNELRTADLDEARESVARSLRPHRLRLARGTHAFDLIHNVVSFDQIAFHYIDYGGEVEVEVDALDFLLVQIPLDGHSTIRSRDEELVATPALAAVTPATGALRMRYSVGNPRLMVRIDRRLLAARLGSILGAAPTRPVEFELGLDLSSRTGQSWRAIVDFVIADLERGGLIGISPVVARTFELAVVDALLAAQRHSYTDRFADSGLQASPRMVRQAAALIDDHCAEALTTADVAEYVGVSVRSLQLGFRHSLGTTPTAYLRRARLRGVREYLASGSAASVTEAALRWGVPHLGRFAGDYRRVYGETPSQTLRRSR